MNDDDQPNIEHNKYQYDDEGNIETTVEVPIKEEIVLQTMK